MFWGFLVGFLKVTTFYLFFFSLFLEVSGMDITYQFEGPNNHVSQVKHQSCTTEV